VLLIEIAEMDALTRAAPSAIKAFLTRRADHDHARYHRGSIMPRQLTGQMRREPVGSFR
jgi:predicted P-loop ATPase